MVVARGCNFEGAASCGLAADGREVAVRRGGRERFERVRIGAYLGERGYPVEPAGDGADVRRAMHSHAVDEHGLVPVAFRDDRVAQACLARASEEREDAADRAELARERQLAHQKRIRKLLGGDAFTGREHGDSNCQIEAGSGLGKIAWREVENQVARRKREPDGRESGANANAAFANAALGKPDDIEAREPVAEAHLDLNRVRLDADQARCMRRGEHA